MVSFVIAGLGQGGGSPEKLESKPMYVIRQGLTTESRCKR